MQIRAIRAIVVLLSFAVLGVGSVFAGGQADETEVFLSKPPTYISPGHSDTGANALVVQNIKLKIDKNGVVKSYTLNIYNKSGEVVFTKSDANLQGRGFLGDLFKVGEVPQVKIPDTMSWDGLDSKGIIVPDGEYFYQLTVLDSFGKKASTPPLSVVVDTVAPKIFNIESSYVVFSPNGDGVRDTISFLHQTEPGYHWLEEIVNSDGKILWKKEVTAPGDTSSSDVALLDATVWDGKVNVADAGLPLDSVAPEASYTYRITGWDRAGNKVSNGTKIAISNTKSAVSLSVDGGLGIVGPNQPAVLRPVIADTKGLTSWKIEAIDKDGIVGRRWSGTAALPQSVDFTGKGNPGKPETDNLKLVDGTYTFVLSAVFDSGSTVSSDPVKLVLDSKAPQIGIALQTAADATAKDDALIFGGKKKSSLVIELNYNPSDSWNILVRKTADISRPLAGEPVSLSVPLSEFLAHAKLQSSENNGDLVHSVYLWDGDIGTTDSPAKIDTGLYELQLSAVDQAKNAGQSEVKRFYFDGRDRGALRIQVDGEGLSPGGDAGIDSIDFHFDAPVKDGLDAFVVDLFGEDKRLYYENSGGTFLSTLTWKGERISDIPAPDQNYTLQVTVRYRNGDTLFETFPNPIVLDRSRPSAEISTATKVFSPNGDGSHDTLEFVQKGSAADWIGVVRNSRGEEVVHKIWYDKLENWTWDGKDDNGQPLTDDLYSYTLSGKGKNGNATTFSIKDIHLDTLSESISVAVSQAVISPNGDGYLDTTDITPTVAVPEDLSGWEIRIVSEDTKTTRTFQGGSSLPKSITWDGTSDQKQVIDGVFHVDFIAEYKSGIKTSTQSPTAIIVVKNPPVGKVSVDPALFSPDADGNKDTVSINIDARATDRPIATWKVEILEPNGATFKTWEGKGQPPASIEWDGKNDAGEVVQSAVDYTALLTLQDELRNVSRSMATISVDILVFKEGNRLRIALPNIQFRGDSWDLFASPQDVLEKNLNTLRRLAYILNRYSDYKIRIEGHATHVKFGSAAISAAEERDVLQPLSAARALAVKQALNILGIDWDRMTSVGLGGTQPIVPHTDEVNKWKNRRVEFILEK